VEEKWEGSDSVAGGIIYENWKWRKNGGRRQTIDKNGSLVFIDGSQ
jgi:hypothetical protein